MKETIDQNGAGAVKTAKFFTVRNMAFIAVMAALKIGRASCRERV